MPLVAMRRLRRRASANGGLGEHRAAMVRALFASGAADYLHFPTMALNFCLNKPEFNRFLIEARNTGNVALPLVGRLIALESVYRAASKI
jgi:hypothetical protein